MMQALVGLFYIDFNNMELLFIGLGVGAIIAYFLFARFTRGKSKSKTTTQSAILIEKIRSVCKFITVEGNFSEIYHYENVESKWLNLVLGKKKALILIDAKAYIGFDLTKIQMVADTKTKTIRLDNFPQPELMTIETDFKYYDKKEGWLNPFTAADLTEINAEAKQHIIDKVPGSGVMQEASNQAIETLKLMETLVETINWKLDYSAMILKPSKKQLLTANEVS